MSTPQEEPRKFTRVVHKTKSGRIAIMARIDESAPWVQIESILGDDNATSYADEMETFDTERLEAIESMQGEEWGDDAPTEEVK